MNQGENDRWLTGLCCMCYNPCGILVQQKNGLVVDVKGDANNPHSQGKVCAKGKAGFIGLYDPYRLKTPLKRTNPQKGVGVDPGWKEIPWEDALDLVASRLKNVIAEDRRKIIMGGIDMGTTPWATIFGSALGTPNDWICHYFCGNVLHAVHYMFEGAFTAEVDLNLCNYCLMVGAQEGFMVHVNANILSQKMAAARERGMRLVVVDPVGSNAAAKADEWIPIRPGTDGAMALAMLNVLVNEENLYDKEFLAKYTNGPYLVGPDGLHLRDEETGKPLIWDLTQGEPRPYDAAGDEVALEGVFYLKGVNYKPGFQLFKEHLTQFSPEEASRLTTVPAETIRRIAREFGRAARIGSTLVLDGQELPYRPAAVVWTKGLAHKHGMMTGLALELMNVVVGSVDIPGGIMGSRTVDFPYGGPKEGPDGLLLPGRTHRRPVAQVERPKTVHLEELFPFSFSICPSFEEGMLEPEKYHLPYRPEIMLHIHSNPMMSTSGRARMAEVLRRIPFLVCFARYIDETVEFADLVLPDTHYLERFTPFCNRAQSMTLGLSPWYWAVGQRVVQPEGPRPWKEVMLEILHRVGLGPDLNTIFNTVMELKGECRLEPDKRYSLEEMTDIWAKAWFGPEHDLEWFKKHGTLVAPKKVAESYPRPFINARIPLYLEQFIVAGKMLEQVTGELGLSWDTSDYVPLPRWRPCSGHEENSPEFDLYAVNYKVPFHTLSFTPQNSWLNELAEYHPYAYKIMIHREVAARKGIEDGDDIYVESIAGKVKGKAKPTECIHPEVVGIAGTFGHWARGMPLAKGKGVHFNSLLPSTLDRIDMLSVALDSCVRVKVYKASEG